MNPAIAEKPMGLTGSGSGPTEASFNSSLGSDRDRQGDTFGSFGFGRAVHLLRVAGIARIQAGVERVIRPLGAVLSGFSTCFTWHSAHEITFLCVGCKREVHVRFFMAIDAECRNFIRCGYSPRGPAIFFREAL